MATFYFIISFPCSPHISRSLRSTFMLMLMHCALLRFLSALSERALFSFDIAFLSISPPLNALLFSVCLRSFARSLSVQFCHTARFSICYRLLPPWLCLLRFLSTRSHFSLPVILTAFCLFGPFSDIQSFSLLSVAIFCVRVFLQRFPLFSRYFPPPCSILVSHCGVYCWFSLSD